MSNILTLHKNHNQHSEITFSAIQIHNKTRRKYIQSYSSNYYRCLPQQTITYHKLVDIRMLQGDPFIA